MNKIIETIEYMIQELEDDNVYEKHDRTIECLNEALEELQITRSEIRWKF